MSKFLVSEKHRALVLKPHNPAALTALIPSAKPVTVRGRELYAVPHVLDAVRLLRNIGIEAPSPIKHYYKWPGQFKPFHAQVATSEFLTLHRRCFVLNGMGTGKTLSTLWAFDYLRQENIVRKVLVVCPLSIMERAWGDEVFLNMPHLSAVVLHGTAARRRRLLAEDHDVYIINHDGVEIILPQLLEKEGLDVVALDESAVYRNSQTDRFKAMRKLVAQPDLRVWALTGTPTPNAPTDAWGQAQLVAPGNVPKYFKRFRDMTMNKINEFKWVPKPTALTTVYQALHPSIRFALEDCQDLPDTIYQTRHVPLTTEQARLYNDLMARMQAQVEEGAVRAVNAADRLMKLIQVASGTVRTVNGTPAVVVNTARVNEVIETIEQAEGKVIVFVPYVAALEEMHRQLRRHFPTAMVFGGTPRHERDDIFQRFQHAPPEQLRVLVANASVMAHGLTLTAADTIVWVAPTTSCETFIQANHRIIRTGQTRKTLVVMIEGSPAERAIYKRLQGRADTQELLLEAVRSGRI